MRSGRDWAAFAFLLVALVGASGALGLDGASAWAGRPALFRIGGAFAAVGAVAGAATSVLAPRTTWRVRAAFAVGAAALATSALARTRSDAAWGSPWIWAVYACTVVGALVLSAAAVAALPGLEEGPGEANVDAWLSPQR